MEERICIIGGGISGITTALCLQLLGYNTVIYAEQVVSEDAPEDPKFASLYPAASIIPHAVQSEKLDRIFPFSHQVFELLYKASMQGMQMHRHYELFEEETEDPSYARHLKNYVRIDRSMKDIPMRKNADSVHGWAFDCLFTEWPVYISKLYKWYEKSGGRIIRKKVTGNEISGLEAEVVINCCGIWSADLFEDNEPQLVSKGHLIHLRDAPLIRNSKGEIPSYNYTAGKEVYADPDGNATDVYFYPRSNGWILGGSRISGTIDEQGRWQGAEYTGKTVLIDGLEIPRPIYELNSEIIEQAYGLRPGDFSQMKTKIGYRYVRSEDSPGLRLDSSHEYGKTIIHNYGHGGAGVTLSWGCAIYVAGMIEDMTERKVDLTAIVDKLKDQLGRLIE